MDKLRAIEYLIAAAEARSFSAAARRLGVSQPAVQKLVSALETQLGVVMFERRTSGLTITGDGAAYVDRCRHVLEELRQADDNLAACEQHRGLVVVGTSSVLAHDCLGPELPDFHRRYPGIELDFRSVQRLHDPAAEGVDVYVLHGWQEQPDLIRVPIGPSRYCVAASPAYWAAHGQPQRPRDLVGHPALLYHSGRTVLDCWCFQRGDEEESVTMQRRLSTAHRELLVQAALAGCGVARLIVPPQLRQGLVAVLADWTALEAPPLQVLFRAQHRSTARVRCFVEFAARALRRQLGEGQPAPMPSRRPDWWDRRGRSSSTGTRASSP
jgi:DNA-binding transcriptional LysR family regulator